MRFQCKRGLGVRQTTVVDKYGEPEVGIRRQNFFATCSQTCVGLCAKLLLEQRVSEHEPRGERRLTSGDGIGDLSLLGKTRTKNQIGLVEDTPHLEKQSYWRHSLGFRRE